MRAFLLSTVALAGLTAGAVAADLPSRRAPVPYVAVPVFTWTGFYLGVNVGGGVARYNTINSNAAIAGVVGAGVPGNIRTTGSGFTGGGQVGYNYQIGSFVVGIEADAAYTGFGRTRTVGFAGLNYQVRDNLGYLGTVRGRVGYAFDRLMVYGTGGFAYGDLFGRENIFTPGGAFVGGGARSTTATGWAAGGGLEYAIPTDSFLNFLNFFSTSAVTIKAEYLHYDLGDTRYGVFSGPVNVFNARVRTDGDIGRIGVNYKF